MFKNGTITSLLLKEDKPRDSSDYESNSLYNKGYFTSRQTAINIKYRILELHKLNNGDSEKALNEILKEINGELEN